MSKYDWAPATSALIGEAAAQGMQLVRKGPDGDYRGYTFRCQGFRRAQCKAHFRLRLLENDSVVVAATSNQQHSSRCSNRGVVDRLPSSSGTVWPPPAEGSWSAELAIDGGSSNLTHPTATENMGSGSLGAASLHVGAAPQSNSADGSNSTHDGADLADCSSSSPQRPDEGYGEQDGQQEVDIAALIRARAAQIPSRTPLSRGNACVPGTDIASSRVSGSPGLMGCPPPRPDDSISDVMDSFGSLSYSSSAPDRSSPIAETNQHHGSEVLLTDDAEDAFFGEAALWREYNVRASAARAKMEKSREMTEEGTALLEQSLASCEAANRRFNDKLKL